MTKYVIIREHVAGSHQWEDAPREVNYLRNEHRHTFIYEVKIRVEHGDRDVEFFMFKNKLNSVLKTMYPNIDGILRFGRRSCEMISEEVFNKIKQMGFDNVQSVYFYEDGLDGGGVEAD